MCLTQYLKEYAEARGFKFNEDSCDANGVDGSDYEAERIFCAEKGDITLYLGQLFDTGHPDELTLDKIPRDAGLVKESMRLDNKVTGRPFYELLLPEGSALYIQKIGHDEPTNLEPNKALESAKSMLDISLSILGSYE